MVTEIPNPDEHLLPAKHNKGDLFICDVADAVLKDIIPQMEHPFYSLSKKPETKIRRYEHNGKWLEIIPSVKGLATIYDKDILIYCISQIMEKLKRASRSDSDSASRAMICWFSPIAARPARTMKRCANRWIAWPEPGLQRTFAQETRNNGTASAFRCLAIRRKHGLDGRLLWIEIKLSDWVFNAIREPGGADAESRLLPPAESLWNGGFTSWRGSIADGKAHGKSP